VLTAAAEPAAPVTGRRVLVRHGVVLAVVVAAAVLLVRQWGTLSTGPHTLASTDPRWLGLAAAATVLLWTAGTVSQLGSMPVRVPVPRLFAVQFAGTFANHMLPAGAGGMAVNVRFLRRLGLSRTVAVGAVTLNVTAGTLAHAAVLAAAVAWEPTALSRTVPHGGLPRSWPAVAATVVLAVVLVAWAGRRRWAATMITVRGQLAHVAAVVRTPSRAAQLWAGSVAVPVLHCVTLYAVLRSVGGTLPVATVAVTYLLASSVAASIPSPGGFGSLDVALAAGLAAVGESTAVALGAVLVYRLLTVWLPLLPGACVLAVLIRRKVV
jgi:uncharacterized membrane protein YbhN (UPF0104 family)